MLSTMPSAQGAEEWLPRSRHEASSSGKEVFSSRSSNMTDAEAQQLATMVLKVADLRCVTAAAASLQQQRESTHPSTHSPSSPFPFLYSYPSKGLEYSLKWIDKCLDEFFEQGDREKEMGLAVGYDRETCDKPKSQVCIGFLFLALALPSRTHLSLSRLCHQVGFFTFFVQPMYETLGALIPLDEQIGRIHDLTEHWKAQLK
jgi:hypothetical protein